MLGHNEKHPVRVTWTELKVHISESTPLQYDMKKLSKGVYYKAFVVHNNNRYFANIYETGNRLYDQTNTDDFLNNYKSAIDNFPPTNTGLADGNKILVHQTSRAIGTITYFTSASDDEADYSKVGGDVAESKKLKGHHEIGNPLSESKYLYLNTIQNDTYMHEGYLQWKDALNDELTVSAVPNLTTVSAGSSTFYNLYQGYLVVPAAGDGVINVDNMVLVEMPINEFGKRAASFWNADYNTTTKLFENVTAAPLADGQFNMFTVEVTLDRFANKIPLLGDGFMCLQTSDASQLSHGISLKVTANTIGADHDWWWNAFATMHRRKTV